MFAHLLPFGNLLVMMKPQSLQHCHRKRAADLFSKD
jgi:hypothetical protein